LRELAEILADWIEPAPGVPAIHLLAIASGETTGPIATSMSGCFSIDERR